MASQSLLLKNQENLISLSPSRNVAEDAMGALKQCCIFPTPCNNHQTGFGQWIRLEFFWWRHVERSGQSISSVSTRIKPETGFGCLFQRTICTGARGISAGCCQRPTRAQICGCPKISTLVKGDEATSQATLTQVPSFSASSLYLVASLQEDS